MADSSGVKKLRLRMAQELSQDTQQCGEEARVQTQVRLHTCVMQGWPSSSTPKRPEWNLSLCVRIIHFYLLI